MLFAFWLLLFLYVGLTLLYAATKTETTKISPWPILTISPKPESIKSECTTSRDCPSSHVCLGNKCIPKLLRASRCNPATGHWISYVYQGATFAICVCSNPHLVTQKYFGGNCDVNVGCGVHGRYNLNKNICECDPGYKAVGFSCQKLPAIDYMNSNPCGPDEINVLQIKPSHGFHKDYIKNLSKFKCVKRPCSFDALSGRPLKRAKYVDGWGCVCDPRYGLFGVVLEGANKKYLNTPGFDACASIFTQDPQDAIDVKLITYFYLGKREPFSLILFDKLNEEDLITPLKGSKQIMLGQKYWQYDYAQYFFKTNPTFRARTRKISSSYIFHIETVNEWHYIDNFSPANCNEIPLFWKDSFNPRVDIYDILYKSPVCRMTPDDPKYRMFWNRVVVNPQQLTFKERTHLHRFNSFVLHYDATVGVERWTLDLDHEYKMHQYLSMETNVPQYDIKKKTKSQMQTNSHPSVSIS